MKNENSYIFCFLFCDNNNYVPFICFFVSTFFLSDYLQNEYKCANFRYCFLTYFLQLFTKSKEK